MHAFFCLHENGIKMSLQSTTSFLLNFTEGLNGNSFSPQVPFSLSFFPAVLILLKINFPWWFLLIGNKTSDLNH